MSSNDFAETDVWLRHSHDGARNWETEQHLSGPFNHYLAPMSWTVLSDGTKVERGLFLGDYMGLETITGDDVINFFTSTGAGNPSADVHSIRADH